MTLPLKDMRPSLLGPRVLSTTGGIGLVVGVHLIGVVVEVRTSSLSMIPGLVSRSGFAVVWVALIRAVRVVWVHD